MKKIFTTTFITLLLLALSSCGQTAEEQLSVQSTMIAYTRTAQAPTPMPPALEFAVAVEQAKSTMAAVEATQVWIYGQLTATQVEKEDRGTKQAAAITQQAFAMEGTATYNAFLVEQAATDRAWYTTQTAAVQATATAYPQTATAQSVYATQTQQAWQTTATMDAAYGAAQATAAYGNAQSVQLTVERDRATNMTKAWLPWMGFVVVLGLIALMGVRWSKVRVVQKDAFGATPALVVDGTIMDMDSSTSMRVLKDGRTEWTQGSGEMTERKQRVDLVRALPAMRPEQQQGLLEMPRQAPRIEVLEDGKMNRLILDDIEDQIVEED